MTSQLQRHFNNNITTLCRRLLIDVFLQRCYNVVIWWNDLKTTTLQRRHDVACLVCENKKNFGRLIKRGTF